METCKKRSGQSRSRRGLLARGAIATVLLAVSFATVPASSAVAKEEPEIQLDPSRPLYVEIAPAVTDAFAWTEFISDRFYGQVQTAFRQAGYEGPMGHVLMTGDPPEGAQLLFIRIFKWRQNFNESVGATVTGSYDSGDGVKQPVSVATGLSTRAVASVDGFSVEDAFFEAARIAARNMYRKIGPPKAPKVKSQ